MSMTEREAEPQFSQPVRQIFMMLVAVGLFSGLAYIAFPRVAPVFLSNPYLNGVILLVFFIGVVACFLQVLQLIFSVHWIEGFAVNRPGHEVTRAPRLLAPLAAMLRSRGARMQISSSSSRSILESVGTRIEEARDITRYIVNLLIFLGLLGTFYGLATTVPAVVETLGALAPRDGESGVDVGSRLIEGLKEQMGGMGTAFASSLLGLAGSLVVGLLELFAGHGQNRFYRELEEWLSSITRVSFSSGEEAGGEAGIAGEVLNHMAEQMDALQAMFRQSAEGRSSLDDKLGSLVDNLRLLTDRQDQSEGIVGALERVAMGQEALAEVMRKQGVNEGLDAESRMRLRSIDVQMLRILEEISAGRQESLSELRKDIDLLVKAFSMPRSNAPRRRGLRKQQQDIGDG